MQNPIINERYRILQQIGVGGFGLTYLAEDLHLPTRPRCVVKHLKPQITDAETLHLANRLFQQEAEILYRLGNHPNIPSLIAHFKENGEFYLVQEYIEGHTIAQEFTGGRKYNQKEMIQLVGQTLEILSFVHTQNVIHRDIKPANLIRRSSDGSIFLIDFGAVKQVNAFPQTSQNSTFSTLTIGSHGYMPTEQMAGKPNFSSDLYALGLIAIEALTGIKPLELKQNNNTNEFIWTHRAQVSPEVAHFISKLVRYDFRQRFHSANEALNALNVIANRVGFFQTRNFVQVAPIKPNIPQLPPIVHNNQPHPPFVPNNHAVSTMTLAPQANVPSTPTLVPFANNHQNNFIPPTIIVPAENPPAFNSFRNLQPIRADINRTDRVSHSSKSGKVAVFVGLMFVLLVGLVFAARTVVKNYQPPEFSQNNDSTDKKSGDQTEQNTVSQVSSNSPMLYEEAIKQAEEARLKERKATTKFEWQEIGNKYRRASALLASINPNNPYFSKAQEKITVYRELAETADRKAETAQLTSPSLNANNSDLKTSDVYVQNAPQVQNPYPSYQDSESKPKRIATMPPPRKGKLYLAYNSSDGDYIGGGKNVVLTDADGNFTVRVERGEIHFRFDGGSDYWTLNLAPAQSLKLGVGSYGGAQRCAFHSPTRPGLDFSGSGRGCNRLSGSFTINQLIYDELYSSVLLLDVTFKQQCEETNPPLMGRLHYDARL